MNIKIAFACLAFCLFIAKPHAALSQEAISTVKYKGHSTKFAFMVTNEDLFKGVVATAVEMEVKANGYDFEIVVVSKLAEDLIKNNTLLPYVDKVQKLGVKIVVCEAALHYFGIKKSQLDKRILTTPNGWIYMLELKDQGFNTLIP